jgi:hypothetical protein
MITIYALGPGWRMIFWLAAAAVRATGFLRAPQQLAEPRPDSGRSG